MATQVKPPRNHGVQNLAQPRRQRLGRGDLRVDIRPPVRGQFHRMDRTVRRQGFLHEHPACRVRAEAVQQHQRNPVARPGTDHAQRQTARIDHPFAQAAFGNLGRRCHFGHGVKFGLGRPGIGDQRDRGATWRGLPRLHQDAPQDAFGLRLDHVGDLLGLDLDELVARGHSLAFSLQPQGNLALGHRHAPFGHGHGVDLCSVGHQVLTTLRTAAAMRAASGR